MAAGDAQRVWFPEMIERLRSAWQPGDSFDAIIEMRDELDADLQRLRSERNIRPPILKCPACGQVGEGAEPHVSVRALILALVRFSISSAEQASDLEKRWAKHRKKELLDLYGKSVTSQPDDAACCAPPQVPQRFEENDK